MLDNIKVSVIVPVYNVKEYLPQCLDSILNQNFDDYEIICINDCTLDDSQAVLDEYKAKYPEKIKLILNERNLGLGVTRNKGIESAVGEYIMFIDSDDYIKNDYIKKYYECAANTKADAVIGGYIRVSNGREIVHKISDNIWAALTYGISCAKMYKREFLLKNNLRFKTYKCGEDVHFNACAFCCGMTYEVLSYEGYYYLDNGQSITNTMNYMKNLEDIMMNIFEDVLETYGDKIDDKKKDIVSYVCYVNILNALLQFNRGCGIPLMKKKYGKCIEYMNKRFPDYRRNPYLRIGEPKGQTAKIRIATGVIMLLSQIHLEKLIFYIVAGLR